MRRKSARNASKTSSEKTKTPETPLRQTRRSRRRKVSESASGSEASDEEMKTNVETNTPEEISTTNPQGSNEDIVWKVTKTESHAGEIQKLKISVCRTSPSTPERTSKRRRNKSSSQTEDDSATEDNVRRTRQHGSPLKVLEDYPEEKEEKKGKGKSKGKHKTKLESTSQVSEIEMQKQYEISENVQVTPQSPSDTDKPVDNESIPEVESNDDNEQKLVEDTNKSDNIEEKTNQTELQEDDKNVATKSIKTEIKAEILQYPDVANIADIKTDDVKLKLKIEESNVDNKANVIANLKEECCVEGIKSETENVLEIMPKTETKVFLKNECKSEIATEVKVENSTVSIDKKEIDVKPDTGMYLNESKFNVFNDVKITDVAEVSAETPITTDNQQSQTAENNTVEKKIEQSPVAIDNESKVDSSVNDKEAIKSNEDSTKTNEDRTTLMENTPDESANKQDEEETKQNEASGDENKMGNSQHSKTEDFKMEHASNESEEITKVKECITPEEDTASESNTIKRIFIDGGSVDITSESSHDDDFRKKKTHRLVLKRAKKDVSTDQNCSKRTVVKVHILEDMLIERSREENVETEKVEPESAPTPDIQQEMQKSPKPVRKTSQPIKLNRNFECVAREPSEMLPDKSKWLKDFNYLDVVMPNLIKVDYDLIKNIYLDVELLEEKEVKLDLVEAKDRRVSIDRKSERKMSEASDTEQNLTLERQSSYNSTKTDNDTEETTNIIAMNRKISIVDDSASKLKPPPSPSKHPVSSVLFITNLVRPFTLKQLKELLERTGKIIDDGFWTDRIKSKCYVQYETQE